MICRYNQYKLSTLNGAEPNTRLQSHMAACVGCREYQEKLKRLDTSLRANKKFAPTPEFASTRPGRSSWAIASVTLAVAAAAVLMVWSFQSSSETSSEHAEIPTKVLPEAATLEQEAGNPSEIDSNLAAEEHRVSSNSTDSALAGRLSRITALNSSTPLEDELDALRSDGARGIKRLLALGSSAEAKR